MLVLETAARIRRGLFIAGKSKISALHSTRTNKSNSQIMKLFWFEHHISPHVVLIARFSFWIAVGWPSWWSMEVTKSPLRSMRKMDAVWSIV